MLRDGGVMTHMMERIVREAYGPFAKQDADRLFGYFTPPQGGR